MNNKETANPDFRSMLSYLRPYKKWTIQIFFGLLVGMILQFIVPFLTQSMVDKGINNRDIGLVYLILIAQLTLFFSQTAIEFIRSWILLHISTRINISLISDFLIKLMRLPIGYFTQQTIGDTIQRIGDHARIESFLTSSVVNISVSCINLIVFGIVLCIFNNTIFGIFIFSSIVYVVWVCLFMKKRRKLDNKRFFQLSSNQNTLFQLIIGIQEIKLNNIERQKRWDWEQIQAKLFNINIEMLLLNQYQQLGSMIINQLKNIVISFFSAKAVIDGNITLGTMMAIQYIVGQLNNPIEQLIFFFRSMQDAKISLERLGEVYQKKDEEDASEYKNDIFPASGAVQISNLNFKYDETGTSMVLENINVTIPRNKITAVVGASGSGKTTLIKILLGFYEPLTGEIKIGNTLLNTISRSVWREKCGAVMQDGFIFSDTILKNITLTNDSIDQKRLFYSVKTANIQEYIESLPLNYHTVLGRECCLSQGQKQRILIARTIYKNPEFVLFDEATNSLDTRNEKVIIENLTDFFKGKTVITIAHRLSSVKNADQIIVLDSGKIVEVGKHHDLIKLEGTYFNLIKNQLELGG